MQSAEKEKVILVGCQLDENDRKFRYSMDELASLTATARGEVIAKLQQSGNACTLPLISARASWKSFIGLKKNWNRIWSFLMTN